jgi:hypothetical protein
MALINCGSVNVATCPAEICPLNTCSPFALVRPIQLLPFTPVTTRFTPVAAATFSSCVITLLVAVEAKSELISLTLLTAIWPQSQCLELQQKLLLMYETSFAFSL